MDYRRLVVWQISQQFAAAVYRVTGSFPDTERYGLSAQLRRAAISIPSNLAEGFGRRTQRERARFVSIASGSAAEIDSQLHLSSQLGFLEEPDRLVLVKELTTIRKMLTRLHQRLLSR